DAARRGELPLVAVFAAQLQSRTGTDRRAPEDVVTMHEAQLVGVEVHQDELARCGIDEHLSRDTDILELTSLLACRGAARGKRHCGTAARSEQQATQDRQGTGGPTELNGTHHQSRSMGRSVRRRIGCKRLACWGTGPEPALSGTSVLPALSGCGSSSPQRKE